MKHSLNDNLYSTLYSYEYINSFLPGNLHSPPAKQNSSIQISVLFLFSVSNWNTRFIYLYTRIIYCNLYIFAIEVCFFFNTYTFDNTFSSTEIQFLHIQYVGIAIQYSMKNLETINCQYRNLFFLDIYIYVQYRN